jgi:hypothetical protein
MRASKALVSWLFVVQWFSGCVEPYYPGEEDVFTGTLVVNAHLSDVPDEQTIQVSRSDKLYYSVYKPESGCLVEVENQKGDVVVFGEKAAGDYTGSPGPGFLRTGYQYRLRLVTANGSRYESDFTQLPPSSPLDSVYYALEYQPTSEPGITLEGLRFYMDFQVEPISSGFLRWDLIETYEFHNPDYDGYIYDLDRVVKPLPDSLSDRQCWITGHVNLIRTLDAGNFEKGGYARMPLHFVSNETQRLQYGYSLLVRQLSMTEPAFRYWDELKKNTQEMTGMYDRQPSLTPGNICNCNDPGERVLGYFSVSGVSEKRIFVGRESGVTFEEKIFCFPAFERPRFRYYMNQDLPLWMSEAVWPPDGRTYLGETPRHCLDCRLHRGSSGEPPDYWQFE